MTLFDSIIFDLGGVIINIDVDRALGSFSEISGSPKSAIDWEPHFSGFIHQFEIGKISESDFRDSLRAVIGKNLKDEALDDCWNQLLLDIPKHRLDRLQVLRKKYRIALLSNTNSIHTRNVHSLLQRSTGAPDFATYFDSVYYSYQMNLAKPDPRIFEAVIKDNNFRTERTLLVDDNQDNIQAAAQLGLQVFQVKDSDDWVDYLT